MILQSHFGVYALIADDSTKKFLLIKKALGCYTGLYDLPGGTMEPHELLEETLVREVFEETDCTVTSFKQLGTFSVLYPYSKNGQDHTLRHIGTVYTAAINGTPRTHSTGLDDSDGCVWMAAGELQSHNAAPFVLQAIGTLHIS